jgi:hypothetical protein
MDDSAEPPNSDWIRVWIEQQRVLLQQRNAQLTADADPALRQRLLELGTKWLDTGQAYLSGLQQFSATTEPAAGGSSSSAATLGEQVLNAWQGHWQSAANAGAPGPDSAAIWAQVLRQIPPVGLAREQHAALEELADLHAQCQRLQQALRTLLHQMQVDALELLERRARERRAEHGALKFRELYDLWVECSEQVYARLAHSEPYCQLQAQLGNATVQLRSRQQQLIEQVLKQFDLPTRSELNSVHRQLREQARLLRELQAQVQTVGARNRGTRPSGTRARNRGATP